MERIEIDIRDDQVPALLGVPDSGSGPGVIVIQEWWGLLPHIEHVVQRFADAGFVALAVDHYRGARTTEPDEAQKLMLGLNIEQVAADLSAAADELIARDDVAGDGVGVVGFCMGGGLALLAPTVSDVIRRTVAFYPAMPWPHFEPDWAKYTDKSALVNLAENDDPGTPMAVETLAGKIRAAGGTIDIVDYPGTSHAFFNDDRPEVYNEESAGLAWSRMLDFFRAS